MQTCETEYRRLFVGTHCDFQQFEFNLEMSSLHALRCRFGFYRKKENSIKQENSRKF